MKCKNCPALCVDGYEYPEEYCSILPEDEVREFADGEYGCLLRKATIEKRVAENEVAFSKHCEDMGKWYVQTEEIEGRAEMLAECVEILRVLRTKDNVSIDTDSRTVSKLLYCGLIEGSIFATDSDFIITEAGIEWMNKYSEFDLFDVEFVVCGSIDGEYDNIGSRIECNGLIKLPGGGFALKDGRAWYSVLAKTPQEALSIANKLFEEDDFRELHIADSFLEHIYQASEDKYFYREDL